MLIRNLAMGKVALTVHTHTDMQGCNTHIHMKDTYTHMNIHTYKHTTYTTHIYTNLPHTHQWHTYIHKHTTHTHSGLIAIISIQDFLYLILI